MTQTERTLAMLRDAGARGVCSHAFYAAYLPHARNRIAIELRDRGFVIAREPCRESDHGSGTYYRYTLEYDPERVPQQERMAI